ncbi:hypothetical protein ABGB07_08470 [Micromonosporaceae bacterium B7E4]
MTPMVMTPARVTTLRREVWRHCECCDELAAMAPHASVCDVCAADAGQTYPADRVGGGRDE